MSRISAAIGLFVILYLCVQPAQRLGTRQELTCSMGRCLPKSQNVSDHERLFEADSQFFMNESADPDSVQAISEEFKRVAETMLDDHGTIVHGIDTARSPCDDHYQFVNNGWRSTAKIPQSTNPNEQLLSYFSYAKVKLDKRIAVILDSAKRVHRSTKDATLKTLGTFYASCMAADTLEYEILRKARKLASKVDSTRDQECISRTLQFVRPAVGQLFAEDLKKSGAIIRMESLTSSLRKAAINRLKINTIMSPDEKANALERLEKLRFRVGIPDKLVDYSTLMLSSDDYYANKVSIAMFDQAQWIGSVGESARDMWKTNLLAANAYYHPGDHAIEISTLLFYPPFFYTKGDDILNYAGVGYVIGHEIFHSIAQQLPAIQDSVMRLEIDRLKSFITGFGKLDGWSAMGQTTFSEDVADLGGGRVAYAAWRDAAIKNTRSGARSYKYTPDQQFFIAIARVWREKWTPEGIRMGGLHSPGFVRGNALVMQNPEFRKAFGCQPGDRMYLSDERMSKIW